MTEKMTIEKARNIVRYVHERGKRDVAVAYLSPTEINPFYDEAMDFIRGWESRQPEIDALKLYLDKIIMTEELRPSLNITPGEIMRVDNEDIRRCVELLNEVCVTIYGAAYPDSTTAEKFDKLNSKCRALCDELGLLPLIKEYREREEK